MKTLHTLFIFCSLMLVANLATAQCNYSIYMHDSWGDGWNGASLDVTVAGVTTNYGFTGTQGSPAGADQTVFFQVNNNDAISVSFNSGTYDNEIYYEIKNADGIAMWDDGVFTPCCSNSPASAPLITGVVYTGTAICPTCPQSSNLSAVTTGPGTASLYWSSFNTPINFDIELGFAGFMPGTGTVLSSTVDSIDVMGLQIDSTYEFYVRDVCSTTDSSTWTGPFSFLHGFCFGGPSSTEDSNIQGLSLQGNTCGISYTGCGSGVGEGGFTGVENSIKNTDLSPDSTYTMSVTFGSCDLGGNAYDGVGTVWIDWDGDMTFDLSDTLLTASFTGADQPLTRMVTFTVPSTAAMGTVKMRAIQQESGSLPLDPCSSFTWGSVTDFNIEIGAPACVVTAPYMHSFENGGVVDTCWTQATDDDFDWEFINTPTVSGNTGPQAAHGGSYYAFIETSDGVALEGDEAILQMPTIDMSGLTAPGLQFYYHMFGVDMGTLRVEASNCDTSWTTVWEKSGDQGDAWKLAQVDMSSFSGSVKIRFMGIDGIGFTGDAAIDDVEVTNITCFAPTDGSAGNPTQTTVDVSWMDSSDVIIEYGSTGFVPGTGAGTMMPVSNSNMATVSSLMPGTAYDFWIQLDCGGSNSIFIGPYTVNTFCADQATDYAYGFESATLDVCWVQDQNDNFDWSLNTDTTGSPGTGPSGAHTGQTYAYIETSTPRAPNDTAILYTAPVDLSGVTVPTLKFFYHMFGSASPSMGTLSVDVESPAFSGNWTNVFSASGEQQIAETDPYLEGNALLTAFVGQSVRARFSGIIGVLDTTLNNNQVWQSDIAIDDVSIGDACATFAVSDSTIINELQGADGEVSVTISGGVAPYTYTWSNGATTANITGLTSGIYTVTITDSQGCSTTASFDVQNQVNTTSITDLNKLLISPNPANYTTNVKLSFSETKNSVEVAIFSTVGQLLMSQLQSNVTETQFTFDVQDLPNGVYLIKVNADGNQTTTKRLMINH